MVVICMMYHCPVLGHLVELTELYLGFRPLLPIQLGIGYWLLIIVVM